MKNILFRAFVVMVFVLAIGSAFAIKVLDWDYTDYSKNFKCSHCQQIVDARDQALFRLQVAHMLALLDRLIECKMSPGDSAVQEVIGDYCHRCEALDDCPMTYSLWIDIAQAYNDEDLSEFHPRLGAFLIQAMKVYAEKNLVDKN